jgi:hypothetical protein
MADRKSIRFVSGVGGSPTQFMKMASELLASRTSQGKGKTVVDKTISTSAGNPKQFQQMASELQRSQRATY